MSLDWLEGGVFLRDPSESNFDLKIESVTKEIITPEFNNPLSKPGFLKYHTNFCVFSLYKYLFHR